MPRLHVLHHLRSISITKANASSHRHLAIISMAICVSKDLCKATEMPIPMALNMVPPKPQHPCTVCGGGAHGSGFGCCQLFSDVLGQLNLSHSRLVNNKDTNSGSAVIFNIFFNDLEVDNDKGGGGGGGGDGGDKDDNEDVDDNIVMVNYVVEARGVTEASTWDVSAVAGAAAGNVSVPTRPKKHQTLSLSVSTKKVTAQKKKNKKAQSPYRFHYP